MGSLAVRSCAQVIPWGRTRVPRPPSRGGRSAEETLTSQGAAAELPPSREGKEYKYLLKAAFYFKQNIVWGVACVELEWEWPLLLLTTNPPTASSPWQG